MSLAEPFPQPFWDTATPDLPVRGFLHRPDAPNHDALILTHGAGSNCRTPLLVALADAFCASGFTILRCDLPFRQSRPTGPPPRGSAERDQAGLRAAVTALHCEMKKLGAPGPGSPQTDHRLWGGDLASGTWEGSQLATDLKQQKSPRIFLGGHSYGGRQASILAASDPALVAALLLLSFPLHPPQRPEELRSKHFPHLQTPALFVHGARDGFGSIEEMETALRLIPARTQLLPIDSAGHELLGVRNRRELPQLVVSAFLSLIA